MYRRLLIVVDDDAVSRAGMTQGVEMARALRAEVLFFHVPPPSVLSVTALDVMPLGEMDVQEHERQMRERGAKLLAEGTALALANDVTSRGLLGPSSDPAACVAQVAEREQCDLIVVGAYGRNAFQRLLHGSLAVSLLPLTSIPLLVCKRRDESATVEVDRAVPADPAASAFASTAPQPFHVAPVDVVQAKPNS